MPRGTQAGFSYFDWVDGISYLCRIVSLQYNVIGISYTGDYTGSLLHLEGLKYQSIH